MKILDRFSGALKFEFEAPTIKLALEAAVARKANLRGADLYGANLRDANLRDADLYGANLRDANLRDANLYGANLRGADLYGANLRDANLRDADESEKLKLVGKRPVMILGPLGSREDHLTAFITDGGVWIRAGCFWGTLSDFAAAVAKTHGSNEHAQEYAIAIDLIQLHAKLSGVK